ncbi:helix-turn-helix domain-containing protein [Chitinophaga lutea]
MDAAIHTLYESGFYRILDFKCRCTACGTSRPEYTHCFSISFVRTGNFLFNVFRHSFDSYNGCVLITKPGYEHTVTHAHEIPDECTIIEFKPGFYAQLLECYGRQPFFQNADKDCALIKVTAETEFLHYQIVRSILTNQPGKLEIDGLVLQVIERTLGTVTDFIPDTPLGDRLKRNHLRTVETAKDYMMREFSSDISLTDVAAACCVSPFHFSRIFKTITDSSPHQFLLSIRLKNAELLLKSTAAPVADVAFASGFNSVDHFTASFSQKYNCSPAKFRRLPLVNAQDS